jgi:hypothetical protein
VLEATGNDFLDRRPGVGDAGAGMNEPEQRTDKEQLLLQNARRESRIIMIVWALCLVWSVGLGYVLGYRRPAEELTFILGMPDWVFWSVLLPWGGALIFGGWFCFGYMADDDLGQDPIESDPHA